MGAYAASLATFKAHFELEAWQIAAQLFIAGIGSITAMQIGGRLADNYGARRIALVMILPLPIASLWFALSPTWEWLLPGCFVFGIGNGGLDIVMNALAVHVEKNRPKPLMSFFHGMWAVGNLVGAASVPFVADAFRLAPYLTMKYVFFACAAFGVALLISAWAVTPETPRVEHVDKSGEKLPIPKAAWMLGLMAIAFGLGEGTASDWSAIHVTTVAAVDPTTGALAVTAMSSCMVIIRLLGDFLVSLIGRRNLVRLGGCVAVIGYLTVSTQSAFPVLLAGWALVGLGMGVVAPQVYAIAGHSAGGRGLAVVVTFGYATFLLAPAVMGAIVSAIGVQHTMFVPAVLLVGLVVLASTLPKREDDPSLQSA
jgi:MFS family permease